MESLARITDCGACVVPYGSMSVHGRVQGLGGTWHPKRLRLRYFQAQARLQAKGFRVYGPARLKH